MAGSIPASATNETPLARPAPARVRGGRAWARVFGSLGVGITCALIAVALLASRIAPGDPFASVAPPLQPPSGLYLMGTDDLGRDLFTGVVHGARTSLVVAGAVTVLALLLGVTVGRLAGWRRCGSWTTCSCGSPSSSRSSPASSSRWS